MQAAAALTADGTADGATDSSNPGPSDPLFSILTNKISLGNGEWKLVADEPTCTEDCHKVNHSQSASSKNRYELLKFKYLWKERRCRNLKLNDYNLQNAVVNKEKSNTNHTIAGQKNPHLPRHLQRSQAKRIAHPPKRKLC